VSPADPQHSTEADAAEVVRAFVRDLATRYERRRDAEPTAAGLDDLLTSLALAEPAIRLRSGAAGEPAHLAVIGPTQVGKSTIVNLLLGADAAEVSPLAGFTVHAQGFCAGLADDGAAWRGMLFPGWTPTAPEELDRERLEAFALHQVERPFTLCADGAAPELPPCVVWDTPDFDSLSAGRYQRAVLETAALADAYLLVLSKEKYSDLSVWKMLRLLEPLGRPLVIVLNKLTTDSAEVVLEALRRRVAEQAGGWGEVPLVPLAYGLPVMAGAVDPAVVRPLVTTVGERLNGARRSETGVRAFVAVHWENWCAPVQAEHAALAAWSQRVDAGLEEFEAHYRRDYLEHPHRYDAFRRAAIELLQLLEIPKFSGWVSKARQAVTWPMRQLWQTGRQWRASRRKAGLPAAQHHGAEEAVLADGLDALLTGLVRDVARRSADGGPGGAVWRALGRRLQAEETRLRAEFSDALSAHHAEVNREVRAVAEALYGQLQREPGRLLALRGARATLDVGALVLAVKTGGLSLVDALWAPATFALSSLLVEGFAGLQMSGAARDLKKRQREAVERTLLEPVLGRRLRALAEGLDEAELIGVSAERLEQATRALRQWEGQSDG
jgi:hypothetical protein